MLEVLEKLLTKIQSVIRMSMEFINGFIKRLVDKYLYAWGIKKRWTWWTEPIGYVTSITESEDGLLVRAQLHDSEFINGGPVKAGCGMSLGCEFNSANEIIVKEISLVDKPVPEWQRPRMIDFSAVDYEMRMGLVVYKPSALSQIVITDLESAKPGEVKEEGQAEPEVEEGRNYNRAWKRPRTDHFGSGWY